MGKFVLIGGGENGWRGTKYETESIDRAIVGLTQKERPNYLLIAFASDIPELYFEIMHKIYNDFFGCNTDYLTYTDLEDSKRINEKIQWADIIYVGGGNTLRLMKILRKKYIDRYLYEAYKQNKVLCGVSAGAICWCDFGNSASIVSKYNQYIKVRGLGYIHLLLCPHYDVDMRRKGSLKKMMESTYRIPALALDNGAAIKIVDDEFCIITSKKNAKAVKYYWKNNIYVEENINTNYSYKLECLYKK